MEHAFRARSATPCRGTWRTARALATVLAMVPGVAIACDQATRLEGVLSIPQCDPATSTKGCIPAGEALYQAGTAFDIADVFTISLQTSPWRMYDAEDRILTVDEVAALIRAKRTDTDRGVYLAGSWTAAMPDGSAATLAQRLSSALDGFPVDGSDGFLWMSATGELRTTHQAFSVWKTGPYAVERGAEVLTALVPGWAAQFEERFAEEGNAIGVVRAGLGYDVFMLCQPRALAAFERAGDMGNAIGAYNAGLMHAEAGDRAAAITWLQKAQALGEGKAATALSLLDALPGTQAK
ncbi:hypothetical protein LJR143_003839 [Pseudoxanthomonas sp. LjRoot143]|uniref:hypothetical protein n=1 Tax=Pseudoxanthomonas sp. LjRoot143 TaxID=3342266 RepID=UPI003ECE05CF